MPHLGGNHAGTGSATGRNDCLIRVRPLIPWMSGCATRAYFIRPRRIGSGSR